MSPHFSRHCVNCTFTKVLKKYKRSQDHVNKSKQSVKHSLENPSSREKLLRKKINRGLQTGCSSLYRPIHNSDTQRSCGLLQPQRVEKPLFWVRGLQRYSIANCREWSRWLMNEQFQLLNASTTSQQLQNSWANQTRKNDKSASNASRCGTHQSRGVSTWWLACDAWHREHSMCCCDHTSHLLNMNIGSRQLLHGRQLRMATQLL